MGLFTSKHDHVPPFIPECELLFEDGPDSLQLFQKCKKNPGHRGFIPVNEFNIYHHLAKEYQSEEIGEYIKEVVDRTVKIIANNTSRMRPDTYPNSQAPYPYRDLRGRKDVKRCGTCFITGVQLVTGSCPCPLCKKSDKPETEYVFLDVRTAAHVVFDDSEAEHVICELFYDTEERENVKSIYGIKLENPTSFHVPTRCQNDTAYITCVTHDLVLMEHIPQNTFGPQQKVLPMIVSHPHGQSKKMTMGTFCYKRTPIPPSKRRKTTTLTLGIDLKCRLAESAQASSIKGLQRFLNSNRPCEFGLEYELREEISLLFPPDATYLCEKWILDGDWVTFPQQTRFTSGNKKVEPVSLPDVEFFVPSDAVKRYYPDYSIPFFVVYDTDTCPGSSGAKVLCNDTLWHCPLFPYVTPQHSGALEGRLNRSGQFQSSKINKLQRYASAIVFCDEDFDDKLTTHIV